MTLGKHDIKPRWESTTHPLECIKFKKYVTIPSVGNRNSKYNVDENVKELPIQSNLAVSHKVKQILSIQLSSYTSRYLPQSNKDK